MNADLSIAALIAAYAPGMYLTFLTTTERLANADDVKAIREVEILGSSYTVGMGIAVSAMTGSGKAFMLSVLVAGGMVALYEYNLRKVGTNVTAD